MGTAYNQAILHGIAIPDERVQHSALTSKSDATNPSAYTQAGPRAGVAVPGDSYDMGIETGSGVAIVPQDASLEVYTGRAGHPIQDGGAFYFRNLLNSDTVSKYKGWDYPATATNWRSVVMTTSAVNEYDCNVLCLRANEDHRGKLLTVAEASVGVPRIYEYDPATGTAWTDLGALGVTVSANSQFALVELPSGRVLCFYTDSTDMNVDVRYSDDGGDTWAEYARNVLGSPLVDSADANYAPLRLQADYSNGQILMLVGFADSGHGGNPMLAQYASIDLGGTFTLIKGDFHITPSDGSYYPADTPTVTASPDGGFIVTCFVFDDFNNKYTPALYRLGTAYTPLDDVTPVLIADYGAGVVWDAFHRALTHYLDEDQNLYIIHTRYDTANTRYKLHVYRSTDLGQTSATHVLDSADFTAATEYLYRYDAASTGGKALLVTRFETDGAIGGYDGPSVCSLGLGSFAAHTLPYSAGLAYANGDDMDVERNTLTWAPDYAITDEAALWVPMALPANLGWIQAGAGSAAVVATAELNITTTVAQTLTETLTTTSTATKFLGEWAVRLDGGDGDKTANDISINVRFADAGSFEGEVSIRLESDGFIVYDEVAAASKGTVTIDMTSTVRIRLALEFIADAIYILLWTCSEGHIHEWAERIDSTLGDRGITANSTRVIWGHRVANDGTSYWRFSAFSMLPSHWSDRDSGFATDWDNPKSLHPHPYSTSPQLLDDGIYIAARSGSTRIGETWQIDAEYDYPLWALDPRLSPRPSVKWRSTSTSGAVSLVYDLEALGLTATEMDSSLLAVWFLGANFEIATIAGWNVGGAVWDTLATLTASTGYTNLRFARAGRKLRPDWAQTTKSGLYLYSEDHVGDTFDLGAAGAGEPPGKRYVKIEHNTEGAWRAAGAFPPSTKTPVLTVDTDYMNGHEVASGTGEVWRRNFGVILKGYTGQYERIRIQIPVQSTADGYFEAGTLFVGPIHVLAQQYDRGWEFTHLHAVDVQALPDDSELAHRRGLERRRITFALMEGAVDLTQTDAADPSPDYRVAETAQGIPVGTPRDTTRVVEGIIRRAQQAVTPVLLLPFIKLDTTGGATTKIQQESHSRAWLYGRLKTNPMVTALLGTEATSEVERVQTVTIDEVT